MQFKKKMTKCPNHKIPDNSLLEIFYGSLNNNTKAATDIVAEGALMSHLWEQAVIILDKVTKTNRAWYPREAKATAGTYAIGMFADQCREK